MSLIPYHQNPQESRIASLFIFIAKRKWPDFRFPLTISDDFYSVVGRLHTVIIFPTRVFGLE
jgi:hypothetical protein